MSAIEGVQHCKLCGEEATVPGHPELIFAIVEKNGTTPVGFLCAPCWEQLTPKNPNRKTKRIIEAHKAIVAGPPIPEPLTPKEIERAIGDMKLVAEGRAHFYES